MKTGAASRQIVLGVALLLTIGATAYAWVNDQAVPDAADLVVAVVEPRERISMMPVAKIAKDAADQLLGRELHDVERDIFSVPRKEPASEPEKTAAPIVTPPPPPILPPVLPVAPPPPVAPSLPFTYIGKLGEDGKYTVFLSARGRNYAVKAGETIAQFYRVEEIRPPMMTVTYLPMNAKQTIQLGEMN